MTTCATLKSDIATYMARSDLTSVIPTFIRLAESRIRKEVRCMNMQTSTSLTITSGEAALPSDFNELISIVPSVVRSRGLIYQPPSTFYTMAYDDSSGNANFFTIEGDTVKFAPAPADNSTATLIYWKAYTALSADADTNWLLTNHYDIYLYACLAEAKAFIEDDEAPIKWLDAYDIAKMKVNKVAKMAQFATPLTRTTDNGT